MEYMIIFLLYHHISLFFSYIKKFKLNAMCIGLGDLYLVDISGN